MKLFLAPMEGVVDWVTRDMLTSIGGIDQCVTEFIRVTDRLLPDRIFLEYCPELLTNSRTRVGTPVFVQLLGGQAEPLAQNAVRAVELGASGVDFNFGCPAKTVNRHDGGASLLKCPERIFQILSAARKAVPPNIPLTAKIRLGFDNPSACIDTAQAVEAAGVSTLTVHCRTKTDMYKPPAYWEWIPQIKAKTKLHIVANGEVWSVADYVRCREVTGCDDVMIGRGALSNPFIFSEIKHFLATAEDKSTGWIEIRKILPEFFKNSTDFKSPFFAQARTKQWLSQIAKKDQEVASIFDEMKVITNPVEFQTKLHQHCLN